jgi:hypothetical protein
LTFYRCYRCAGNGCCYFVDDGSYKLQNIPRVINEDRPTPEGGCWIPELKKLGADCLAVLTCPLCGASCSVWKQELGDCNIEVCYSVCCDNEDCGCETKLCGSPQEAILIWNREGERTYAPIKKVNW